MRRFDGEVVAIVQAVIPESGHRSALREEVFWRPWGQPCCVRRMSLRIAELLLAEAATAA